MCRTDTVLEALEEYLDCRIPGARAGARNMEEREQNLAAVVCRIPYGISWQTLSKVTGLQCNNDADCILGGHCPAHELTTYLCMSNSTRERKGYFQPDRVCWVTYFVGVALRYFRLIQFKCVFIER